MVELEAGGCCGEMEEIGIFFVWVFWSGGWD
jgi:hypothetical protein